MTKKFKFELMDMMFQLPVKFLRTKDWSGNKLERPEIYMSHAATSNVMKQYVKMNYPNVVVSVSSSSFANGNSVDVYLSDERGFEVDQSIVDDVRLFGSIFVPGNFNGMTDSYDMKEGPKPQTDNQTKIYPATKYLHVQNRPKFGSVPDIVRMLREMTTTENYVFGKISLDDAMSRAIGYGATEKNVAKAVNLLT